MRSYFALTLALVLAAQLAAGAQQRTGRGGATHSSTPVHSTPAPGSRVTSMMTVRDRRSQPDLFLRHGLRRNAIVPLPFFVGFGVPVFYEDAPALTDDGPTGGVQLDVTPWRSRVYVDGVLQGRVDDFKGYYRPLELVAGPHQITIVDEGRQPLVVDLVVAPGRTLTYRATLSEAASR